MGIFKPHFYVTGEQFGDWTEVLSYEINDNFFSGEVLPPHEYYPRIGNIKPRLMYMLTNNSGIPHISFNSEEWATCPPLWFAYIVSEYGIPPNISVMAFATPDFDSGQVVTANEAAQKGIAASQQIAAIQWGYKDPKMHQIFVHPDWRRRRISAAMIGAADLINLAGNFSPGTLLYGGDVTTAGGEHLRNAWGTSPRVIQRQGTIS